MKAQIQVAVRRQWLPDGCEWGIYFVNADDRPVVVNVESASFEWGDEGHSSKASQSIPVPAHASALVFRANSNDAEISMNLTLRVQSREQASRVTFELGKLYRYRNAVMLEHLGFGGWLRDAERVVALD